MYVFKVDFLVLKLFVIPSSNFEVIFFFILGYTLNFINVDNP